MSRSWGRGQHAEVNVAGYAPSTPSSSSAASLYQGCSNGSHGGAVEDDGARNARAELVSTHGVYDGMPCSTARRSSYGARTVYSAHRRHRDLPALLILPALRPRNWEPQSSTSIETAAGGVESASGARPSTAYPCRLVSAQHSKTCEQSTGYLGAWHTHAWSNHRQTCHDAIRRAARSPLLHLLR
jgi:hypothetical protein